jgi:hypothetical protein
LALLELIRDKLVWAEQREASSSQIFLRALTDEPAEQAVQKAILEYSEEREATRPVQPSDTKQPFPIAELPAKPKSEKAKQPAVEPLQGPNSN